MSSVENVEGGKCRGRNVEVEMSRVEMSRVEMSRVEISRVEMSRVENDEGGK